MTRIRGVCDKLIERVYVPFRVHPLSAETTRQALGSGENYRGDQKMTVWLLLALVLVLLWVGLNVIAALERLREELARNGATLTGMRATLTDE